MNKQRAMHYLGERVLIGWRDPTSDSTWTCDPLERTTTSIISMGTFVGFNSLSEVVCAAAITESGDYGDIIVIPLSLVDSIDILKESAGKKK